MVERIVQVKIGITGPNGRLGSQLVLMGCTPLECDITKLYDIDLALVMTKPDVIINCAAFTDVDACETEVGWKRAIEVNMRGVENLRNSFSGRLIHISTDYIFNGRNGPYAETNKEYDPVNMYGSSKLGGEVALLNPEDDKKETCIVRTTGLYGATMSRDDVANMIIERLSEGRYLTMTNELMGNQTYVPHLAESIMKLAEMEWKHKIVHIGSDEVISRYEFALMVASVFGLDKTLISFCRNKDVIGWIAPRPKKGGLKTNVAKRLRLPIYTVLDGIRRLRDDTRGI
jgi:dTDP-4-dehydrorhamnose reductase